MRPIRRLPFLARRAGAWLVLSGWVAAVAGCGTPEADAPVTRAARPSGVRAKPPSPVGQVTLVVADRPAPDRAVLEAVWERRGVGGACAVELVLPDGAYLVEGSEVVPVAADGVRGSAAWLVGFPTGRALDAVVRLCVLTPQGEAAAEATARLVEDPAASSEGEAR